MKMTQSDFILNHLRNHGPITSLEALRKYGCFRLASVIERLRKRGYDITTDLVPNKNKNRFAKYSLDRC